MGTAPNLLYYGDNLDILRRYVADESVDLIYLDPPFNSNADYNVLFAEKSGEKAHAQIQAFEDTWEWGIEAAQEYAEVIRSGHDRVAKALDGSVREFNRMGSTGPREAGEAPMDNPSARGDNRAGCRLMGRPKR